MLVDTSFLFASLDDKDANSAHAKKIASKLDTKRLFTTKFVVQEVFWLRSKRINRQAAEAFFEIIDDWLVIPVLPSDWTRQISKVLKKYSSAHIDVADASLVVLADQLNTGQVLSFDRKDFSILRWNSGKKSFQNLVDPDLFDLVFY